MPVENSKKSLEIWFLISGILGVVGGITMALIGLLTPKEDLPDLIFPDTTAIVDTGVYSRLTGLPLENAELLTAPAYCVQIPNGTDGGRPQAGLTEAGVVFEAIAEAGITRFAAIYQNPSSSIIGPIRSLRIYYLQWDTPFDCTIVHAGGSGDALAAVRAGGYKDLSENYTYMYRGTYGSRRWNNLFTTAKNLAAMNSNFEHGGSNISGFKRMTPSESLKSRIDASAVSRLVITEPSPGDTSATVAKVPQVAINFGSWATFNVRYSYNADTNTYARSYATGAKHDVYQCPAGDKGNANPEDVCDLVQLSPSVIAVIVVNEKRASDNYHEDITTIGAGKAYVFQNGIVVRGTWSKGSVNEQIKFFDENGEEVALAPGQTFIEAIPSYGSVNY